MECNEELRATQQLTLEDNEVSEVPDRGQASSLNVAVVDIAAHTREKNLSIDTTAMSEVESDAQPLAVVAAAPCTRSMACAGATMKEPIALEREFEPSQLDSVQQLAVRDLMSQSFIQVVGDLTLSFIENLIKTRSVDSAGAATEEPGAVEREFEPSQSAHLQLAVKELSQSFLQDLCKQISTKAFPSFNDSDGIHPEPLLSKGKVLCRPNDESKRRRSSGDRKGQSSGSRSGDEGLSEDLIELVLSRIPLPYLFKVRGLSRSWFFKFPSQSVRSLQPSFQNHISSVSSQWPTYSPVFVDQKQFLLCFDQTSSTWKRMLSLSYLPTRDETFEDADGFRIITSAGPLLAICLLPLRGPHSGTVIVNNVISRSWRRLPPLRKIYRSGIAYPSHFRVLQVGHDIYEVLLVYISRGETHVYNSRLRDQWTVKRFDPFIGRIFANSAYLDNNLYCLVFSERPENPPLTLWTYQVEQGTWMVTVLHSFVSREDITDGAIFVCKEKVMVAIWLRRETMATAEIHLENGITIFELDLETKRLARVCEGPPILNCKVLNSKDGVLHILSAVASWRAREGDHLKICFSSDADCIYFVWSSSGRMLYPMLAYNVRTCIWSSLPIPPRDCELSDMTWVENAFQPGLNPFAVV